MRLFLTLLCLAMCALAQPAAPSTAIGILRRSVELDQINWLRMADYTWTGRSHERHFDSHERVTSDKREAWESMILDGQPFRRLTERDGRALPPGEQRKEQQRFDKAAAKLEHESPEEKQRNAAEYQKWRRRERAFLLEIPDAYDLKLEGSQSIDGQDVWVISGTPRPGYKPKTRDASALLKVRGKIWIEKAGYQWVKIEAQTTATISYGLFLARLNPGAKLEFEQERVNNEVWLPKREYVRGSGRIGLIKRLAEDQEVTWNDYKKFRVESTLKPVGPQ